MKSIVKKADINLINTLMNQTEEFIRHPWIHRTNIDIGVPNRSTDWVFMGYLWRTCFSLPNPFISQSTLTSNLSKRYLEGFWTNSHQRPRVVIFHVFYPGIPGSLFQTRPDNGGRPVDTCDWYHRLPLSGTGVENTKTFDPKGLKNYIQRTWEV